MIQVKDVNYKYKNNIVLENLSLEIGNGMIGLLGENGAGKTTCIRGLFGLFESDAGDALIFGKPLSSRRERVDTVLGQVSLTDAENRSVQKLLSQGMKQRLALATALLPDPDILLLDEPTNGLDPTGIRWLRMLLRYYVSAGKTVLISSHLLNEVEQTVDDVVILR